MANVRAEAVAALRRRLGHDFADPSLLERALTHASVGEGGGQADGRRPADNERLDVGAALRLSPGETKSGGRRKAGVIADAVEAILAAVYRDGGLGAAKAMFDIAWAEEFASPPAPALTNPKSALQEWAQAQGRPLPTYRVVERTGSDHAPTFVVEATVVGFDPVKQTGRSRQEAEKAAATALLKREGVI